MNVVQRCKHAAGPPQCVVSRVLYTTGDRDQLILGQRREVPGEQAYEIACLLAAHQSTLG